MNIGRTLHDTPNRTKSSEGGSTQLGVRSRKIGTLPSQKEKINQEEVRAQSRKYIGMQDLFGLETNCIYWRLRKEGYWGAGIGVG